jgi:twitching motility protein PilT
MNRAKEMSSMTLTELMQETIARGASDLHLSAGESPRLRIDGVLTDLEQPALSEHEMLGLLGQILPPNRAAAWADDPMASALLNVMGPDGSRFRAIAYKHMGGTAIVMRLWPARIPDVERIGLSQEIAKRILSAPCGLVFATGPAGCGKSTTLYSLVDHLNTRGAYHIVWISEPAEYALEPRRSLIRHIEVGTHTGSFAQAARAALRMDPDIVVLAEMRDLECLALALALAETGHLVMSTLHCPTAAEAVARFVEVFPVEQQPIIARQLADGLHCVIAQRLLRHAKGPGRVAAYELLFATQPVREAIAARRFPDLPGIIASGAEGMRTLEQSVAALVAKGLVADG